MYGETTGEIDEFGLPVRYNWASEYRGKAMVVYGHTPVPEAQWLNKTIDIDTGCVFGGKLTALRYPEKELVSVPAAKIYSEPSRPFLPAATDLPLSLQQQNDTLLDIEQVLGKRIISTKLAHTVTVREENAIAALEVMSRFAVDPRWLIYLPPTMSPSETSALPEYLEHPKEALEYFVKMGVEKVVCEEKHMGSRAIVVLCRDEDVALRRFGIEGQGIGVCYTRTGRNFFNDDTLEKAFLQRVQTALTASNFWEKLKTDWVCLDAELMPWSAKAQALIQSQFAAVGAAATAALPDVLSVLRQTQARGVAVDELLKKFTTGQEKSQRFVEAYRRYCWPVDSLEDYRLAPFHILATEGQVHVNKNHGWHMETIREFCLADPNWLMATPYRVVHLSNADEFQSAVDWWLEMTGKGGEGMVIKPFEFIARGKKGLIQPAIKCRGKEYLRIIYGPEYDAPENLQRLKVRGLGAKRSLAIREFALGVEGLERFVAKEPLRHVHECVFGVLALESEPVDPRL
jgi:polynucleotide kinase-phosphatase